MKRLYLFVFFILSTVNVRSQELHFENLPIKGLPSTETYQVLQASDGMIWMATDAGICKYDGTTATTYTIKDGISENVVLKIYEDKKKRIWFNTLSGYFFYYENGHFIEIAANQQLKQLCTPFLITSFVVGENDTLYATAGAIDGLLKIPPQHNYRSIFKQYGRLPLTFRYVWKNKIDSTELVAGGGLCGFNHNDSTYSFLLFDHTIRLSMKGIQGFFFSGLNGGIKKARDGTLYVPARNKLAVVKNNGKTIDYFYFADDILRITEDDDGDIWIGLAKHGGLFYEKGNMNKPPVHFLPTSSITSVIMDKEGSIWASTLEKGIFQCMNKHVSCISEKAEDLKIQNDELNIALLSKNAILVFKPDSTVPESRSIPALCKNFNLHSFLKTKHFSYYATTKGLFCDDGNVFTNIKQEGRYSELFPNQLLELDHDTIMGLASSLIFKLYGKEIINFIYRFPANFALQLKDNRVIIGCRSDYGLFELKNNKTIPYLSQFPELKTRINWMMTDSNQNLWIATNEKGIFCYDTKNRLHQYSEKNGLVSNKINTCTVDKNNTVWCGSLMGLSKLNTNAGLDNIIIENFDKNHGIPDLEIKNMIGFNNRIWCAAKNTLFYFDPDNMTKNTFPPHVYVKYFTVNNQSLPYTDSLFLKHDQNNIRLQCELITSKKTETKTFLYKLQGYDNDWNISNTGDIQYTNIDHGKYKLVVHVLNNDGLKSANPIQLTFIIKKPFWFAWWFILLEITAFLTFVYIVSFYWKKNIQKKERDKAALNQKIAEFKMTALRAQMNPHFIYNAIGSIQHYILKNEIDQSFNYLSKFSMLIRKILNNSRQEFISLSQEISTLQLYIELEQIRFKYPFKFVLTIDDKLDTEVEIPTMLIQPYIENSIWHGLMPKDTEGLLELEFKKMEETIFVTIRDNGVGREKGDLEKKYHISKGMSLTEQRIKTLESTSTKKFVTTIIDLKDENGNPKGTEVNLVIPFDE